MNIVNEGGTSWGRSHKFIPPPPSSPSRPGFSTKFNYSPALSRLFFLSFDAKGMIDASSFGSDGLQASLFALTRRFLCVLSSFRELSFLSRTGFNSLLIELLCVTRIKSLKGRRRGDVSI